MSLPRSKGGIDLIKINGTNLKAAYISSDLTVPVVMGKAPYSNSDQQEPCDDQGAERRMGVQGKFKGTIAEITAFCDFLDGLINVGTVLGDGAQSKRAAHTLTTEATDLPASKTYYVMCDRAHWNIEAEDNLQYAAYQLSLIERKATALE
jgi:hypothetical protein